MAHPSAPTPNASSTAIPQSHGRLSFNVDAVAIAIALALAALIRLDVIHHIGW